jgi:large subunit ribosomal protein L30
LSAPKTQKTRGAQKTLRVKQVRSGLGFARDQRQTLRGLGLRRPGAVAELEDTPAVRGMIRKIRHLVRIEEAEPCSTD